MLGTIHELKTPPDCFGATWMGLKPFEFRKDDRKEKFKEGDQLTLCEFQNEAYSGRRIDASVMFILRGDSTHGSPTYGVPKGYVVMGLRILSTYRKDAVTARP